MSRRSILNSSGDLSKQQPELRTSGLDILSPHLLGKESNSAETVLRDHSDHHTLSFFAEQKFWFFILWIPKVGGKKPGNVFELI